MKLAMTLSGNSFNAEADSASDLQEAMTALALWLDAQHRPAHDLATKLDQLKEELMAISQAVTDKVNAIKTALDAGVAGIRSDIEALKTQVANGASQEEVLAELDKLSASVAGVSNLDAENPAPAASAPTE